MVLVALHAPAFAGATTYIVGSSKSADFATIQAAVDAATSGDIIEVEAGTYVEDLDVQKNLTMIGAGKAITTIEAASVAIYARNSDLTVAGFTLSAGDRAIYTSDELVVDDVTFTGVKAGGLNGGGIYATGATVTVTNATFEDNDVGENSGGHIYAYNSTVDIDASSFSGGVGQRGGAIYCSNSVLTLTGSTLLANEAVGVSEVPRGGAIRASNSAVGVADVTFDGNQVLGGYGAAISVYQSDLTVSGKTQFLNGLVTDSYGSAITAWESDLDVDGALFQDNVAMYDSGTSDGDAAVLIYGNTVPSFSITESTFDSNAADEEGGAIRINVGSGTIEDCTFTNNSAVSGGGLYITSTEPITLSRNQFSENDADYGSAVRWRRLSTDTSGGDIELLDNTFEDNTVGDLGGAVYLRDGDKAVVAGNTFDANISENWGGAFYLSNVVDVLLSRNTFSANQAGLGGAGYVSDVPNLEVVGNAFCNNAALHDVSAHGGAVVAIEIGDGGTNQWTNNTFVENFADDDGGAVAFFDSVNTEVINNTFVGNLGESDGGAVRFEADSWAASLSFINNIVAFTGEGDGLSADGDSTIASLTYNAWWDNTVSDVGGALDSKSLDGTNLLSNPALQDYSNDGDCTNDQLWLASSSPAIDAGDPKILDPDDTPSDIGAYGGNEADWEAYTDEDGDGVRASEDCDDNDPDKSPDAEEIPYDGIDQDCDGEDLIDVDGDGYIGSTVGGDDCNDTDGDVHPGAKEVPDDGLDNDCDGKWAKSGTTGTGTGGDNGGNNGGDNGGTDGGTDGGTGVGDNGGSGSDGTDGALTGSEADDGKGGCGCATAPSRTPWTWALVLTMLVRGRRRS